MRLTDEGLKDRQVWLKQGYALPEFDRESLRQATLKTPRWIHFGAGNLFRAFPMMLMQKLLNTGLAAEGLHRLKQLQEKRLIMSVNRIH